MRKFLSVSFGVVITDTDLISFNLIEGYTHLEKKNVVVWRKKTRDQILSYVDLILSAVDNVKLNLIYLH